MCAPHTWSEDFLRDSQTAQLIISVHADEALSDSEPRCEARGSVDSETVMPRLQFSAKTTATSIKTLLLSSCFRRHLWHAPIPPVSAKTTAV